MDKQITIDGVDVSGCESFCNGICCKVGFGDDASCKLFSDCNYKQLKRTESELACKEQECETLASQLDFEVQKNECLEQKCKQQSWDIGNLGYKIKNQRHEINNRLKQLKCKEQECEKLKSDLTDLSKIIDCKNGTILTFKQQLDQLKAENEELKKIIVRLDVPKHEVIDMDIAFENEKLKAENEILKEKLIISSNSDKKTFKIIKALTEIKEIAEKASKCLYATKSDDYTDGYRWLGSIILQKISEVENG